VNTDNIIQRLEEIYKYWHEPKVTSWAFGRVKSEILNFQVDLGNGVITPLSSDPDRLLFKWIQVMKLCCDLGMGLCKTINEDKIHFDQKIKLGIKCQFLFTIKREFRAKIEANFQKTLELFKELKELDAINKEKT